MLENAHETIDLATEDIKVRKQVQSQRDFEPLLDNRRSLEASQNAPSNSSHESTAWINSRCPGRKTLALSCLHVGSLARQTSQLNKDRLRNRNISTETIRRSILTVSADTV